MLLSQSSLLFLVILGVIDCRDPRYNPNIRPVKVSSDKVHVTVRLGIKRIFEIDEFNHRVTLFGVLIKRWKDEFLTWEPEDYGGITHIYTDYTKVWNPQLSLVSKYINEYSSSPSDNSIHEIFNKYPVKVFSNGNVEFIPSLHLENECVFNYARFPFEYQICKFNFQMPYNLEQVKLSMSSYYTNELTKIESVWSIEDLDERVSLSEIYPTCQVLIRFKRIMKNNLFTMPSYIVYILTLLMFLLPQQSSQRIIIGSLCLVITTLLSYMLTNSISHNEVNTMPLLGKLYLFNSVLLVVSLAFSAFIIKISSSNHTKAVPDWLKKLTINVLSKIFCVQAIAYTVFNSYNFKAHDDETIAVQEQISSNIVISNDADNVRVRFNNSQSPGPSGQSANIETISQEATSSQSNDVNQQKQLKKLNLSKLLKSIHENIEQLRYSLQIDTYKKCSDNEWLLVSILFDKIFFFIYCFIVITVTMTIFNK